MAYCGTVALHDKNGKSLHIICYGATPNQDVESFCEGLVGDVRVLKRKSQGLKIILICDGAKESWSLRREAFMRCAPELTVQEFNRGEDEAEWDEMREERLFGHAPQIGVGRSSGKVSAGARPCRLSGSPRLRG